MQVLVLGSKSKKEVASSKTKVSRRNCQEQDNDFSQALVPGGWFWREATFAARVVEINPSRDPEIFGNFPKS
jgi:hypothetical protein